MGGDLGAGKQLAAAQPAAGGFWSKLKDDMIVLKNIWFHRASGSTHAERLDSFYRGQAAQYDQFRANFLHGRRPMLEALAARLQGVQDIVWVDLGGGTGENVDMMFELLPPACFKAVYVVDLCGALAAVARAKAAAKGWDNVSVIEGDACTFRPLQRSVTLVTFSYSLSMIPPFYAAVDNALAMLDPAAGLLGVCDFYVAHKYEEEPRRAMSWARRFFWQACFDIDGIFVGPERRQYLEHCRLQRLHEVTSEGGIPYVPILRAPWYVWIGRRAAV